MRVSVACLAVLMAAQSWWDAAAAEDHAPPETIRLTLAEAVGRAISHNPELVEARLNRTLQEFDLQLAEDRFRPEASLGLSTAGYRVDLGADTRGYTFGAGPGVTVRLPTGGEVSLRVGWTGEFGHTGQPGELHDMNVEIGFSHPLLKGAGLEAGLAPLALARLEEQRHILRLRAAAMDVVTSTIESYRSAIRAALQVEINERALQRAEETLAVNRILVDTGRMAQADLVQTEADIARRELDVVRSQDRLQEIARRLNVLLDLDGSVRVEPVEPLTVEPFRPDLEHFQELAIRRNADYLEAQLTLRSAEIRLVQAENNSLWDLSFQARAAFGRQGTSFGAGLRDLAGEAGNGIYSFGLALNIPLNDTAAKALKRARLAAGLNRRKAERALATATRELDTSLRNAVRAVELGQTQMELARQALALAGEKLRIEEGKLKLGLTSNFRLASFQTDYVNAQVSELDAKIGYLNAVAALDRAAGTVLDTWQIEIEHTAGEQP